MKKLLYILPMGLLAVLLVVMVVGTAGAKDKGPLIQNSDSYVNNFCFNGDVSKMDVSDLTNKYTDETNKFFNKNISYIMTHPTETEPSIDLNDYKEKGGGLCKTSQGVDLACQAIALCKGNHSPYCVGVTLLGFSPERYVNYDQKVNDYSELKYSYFCYLAALNTKINNIYDGTPQGQLDKCSNGSEYADKEVCKLKAKLDGENDPDKKLKIEQEMNKLLSKGSFWGAQGVVGAVSSLTFTLVDLSDKTVERVKFIDEEIKRSKQALDQTLDAYSQLKTSWNMHVKYMDIIGNLVQYRNYLKEIRKKTDTFQFKFIDATSTKCS